MVRPRVIRPSTVWSRFALVVAFAAALSSASLGADASSWAATVQRPKIPAVIRYAVAVDRATGSAVADVRAVAAGVFNDPRGWALMKRTRFVEVPWPDARLRIFVTTPNRVDRECKPLPTAGYKSCTKGWDVYVNEDRWRLGAVAARMPLDDYRRYVLNHEVGHALGEHHQSCPGAGRIAPVMLQQTISLQGCKPNPWPNPGAPLATTTTTLATTPTTT